MSGLTYLVFSATGKQGRAVIKALSTKEDVTSIVATSRNPDSNSAQNLLKLDKVTKVLAADFNDPASILLAIEASQANRIWFNTDYFSIPWSKRTRATEAKLGSNVIDAIKEAKVSGSCAIQHVVFSSAGNADNVPKKLPMFWSKADVEKYMASQLDALSVTWSVLRPVAFFDNFDDAATYNPLRKGVVKFLTYPDVKVKFIASEDIGKGCAILLTNPTEYSGKVIEAAGAEHSGTEIAKALSEVSGTACMYKVAVPRFVMWLLMGDVYHMTKWIEKVGYSTDIEAFKKIVPDAQDAHAFFREKGQWANGEKFVSG